MHRIHGVVKCLLMEVGVHILDVVEGHANSSLSASRLAQLGLSPPGIPGQGVPSFFVPSDASYGLVYFIGV